MTSPMQMVAEPVAWRTNVLSTIAGTDRWVLTTEPYVAKTGERVRSVQALGVIADGPPADVQELVLSARSVAFGDGPPDRDQIKRLDAASEAFASRVPWDDDDSTILSAIGAGHGSSIQDAQDE